MKNKVGYPVRQIEMHSCYDKSSCAIHFMHFRIFFLMSDTLPSLKPSLVFRRCSNDMFWAI